MNIKEAKQIPLQEWVERLGGRYSHTDRRGDFWFFSPFRPDEKTASFKVNAKYNNWHDFGHSGITNYNGKNVQGSGGDIIDLWCDLNSKDRRIGIKEALQALGNDSGTTYENNKNEISQSNKTQPVKDAPPRFKLLKIADRISFIGLKEELQRRRISLELANLYLKQGYIRDTVTGKTYTSFLFENDKGGYEVSIPNPKQEKCFKTCIGAKAITTEKPIKETTAADVFEGFWDFLSWLEKKKIKTPMHYSFILNSTSLAGEATNNLIKLKDSIKSVFLFMDNDDAGYQATHFIAGELEPHGFEVGGMEQFYSSAKDLSNFWTFRL
ncbi:toprim domain-containing protein [Mucilaginibacter terrae]|uniref:toprim domain-containing protein n=1 Tax=Mucilaginibacter terrae TaxID=1955052 RepID=UPI003626369E